MIDIAIILRYFWHFILNPSFVCLRAVYRISVSEVLAKRIGFYRVMGFSNNKCTYLKLPITPT